MAREYFLFLLEWFERIQKRPEVAGILPYIDVTSMLPTRETGQKKVPIAPEA